MTADHLRTPGPKTAAAEPPQLHSTQAFTAHVPVDQNECYWGGDIRGGERTVGGVPGAVRRAIIITTAIAVVGGLYLGLRYAPPGA